MKIESISGKLLGIGLAILLSGCGVFKVSTVQLNTSYATGETRDTQKVISSEVHLRGSAREIGLWFKELIKTANDEYIRKQ